MSYTFAQSTNTWGDWEKREEGEGFPSQSFSLCRLWFPTVLKDAHKASLFLHYWQSHLPKKPFLVIWVC